MKTAVLASLIASAAAFAPAKQAAKTTSLAAFEDGKHRLILLCRRFDVFTFHVTIRFSFFSFTLLQQRLVPSLLLVSSILSDN